MINNIYELSKETIEKGYISDDTGVYIPYTFKNEKYWDPREIYLKISRHAGESSELLYTFVKFESGLFYPLESYTSPALINDTDKMLKRKISGIGRGCNLNSGKGIYISFIDEIKDTICNIDGLSILKDESFTIPKIENPYCITAINTGVPNHNFMDMRELCKIALNQEPKYSYPTKGYDMFRCPFHNDHRESARAFKHVMQCFKHTQMQFDQTSFLRWLFKLGSIDQIQLKYLELIKAL